MTPREEVLAILKHLDNLEEAIKAHDRGRHPLPEDEVQALRVEYDELERRPLTPEQGDSLREHARLWNEFREWLREVPCGVAH